MARRNGLVVLGMLAAAVVCGLLSLCLGAVGLTPAQLTRAILQGPETLAGRIFWFVRLPRTLAALLTGGALAVSGVVIQTVLHNPLAAPNIIGVNAGAGFAVALAAVCFPAAMGGTPWLAFAGAMGAVGLVLLISRLTGASKLTLVLGGVMISSLFNAAIDALLTFQPDALTCLTHREGESYDEYVRRAAANPLARKVKMADLTHNMDLSRLPVVTDWDRERLKKYQRAMAYLKSVDSE